MASNCHTCNYRKEAISAWPSMASQQDVCIVTLTFKSPITGSRSKSYIALNTLLNNIVDNEESIPNPSTFTSWSPCVTDPSAAVIITTVRGACDAASSQIFDDIREHLASPPKIQHMHLDLAVMSLATSYTTERIACDIVQLHGSSTDAAIAVGRQFGWDPKRSSLTSKLESHTSAAFSRPGDLVQEFRAWAELKRPRSRSSSISTGTRTLKSPSLVSLGPDEDERRQATHPTPEGQDLEEQDRETLIMVFQWSSHVDGARFKDPIQKSYGPNGGEVRRDLWDREVAHPIAHLQRLGVRMDTYKLELRAVEPRLGYNGTVPVPERTGRQRSRSKRLSIIASELGGRVVKLWK